jgi:multidrug efflux pump subunit AcrA (membrane-fusion protein)
LPVVKKVNQNIMKRKRVLIILGAFAFIVLIFYFTRSKKSDVEVITCKVVKGPMEVKVHTSGQLEAERSENIVVPAELSSRNVQIWEIKISDLVEEGTVVDSGQYVASLDHKTVEEVLTKAREDLELATAAFEDAKLDSNLTLSNLRDQLINSNSDVEEKKIVVAESVYESPSVIKKAEMDLEKASRKLEQDKKGFFLKERQAKSKVDRAFLELQQRQQRIDDLLKLLDALNIKAPKQGMVIYAKDRTGSKIQIGSSVATYQPIIATLPDMTKMISKTYVNEIDISKIKSGQKVTLSIDAFPEKELKGEVFAVANIGQTMPRSDAKVFEVKIRVFGFDPELKPAMTTSNAITTGIYNDQLIIPSDVVYSNDSVKYVYLKKKEIVRQIVDLGNENENSVIVNKGLAEGDELVYNEPENPEEIKTIGWEIYEEQKVRAENEKKKQLEAQKKEPVEAKPAPVSVGNRSLNRR